MSVILFETSIRAKLENWFGVGLTDATLEQGVIYEDLRYVNNTIVVTSFNEDNLQFEKIKNVVFRIKTPYLVL